MYTKAMFTKLVEEFNRAEADLLGVKRDEYASDKEVLMNFDQVSAFEGRRPEELCMTLILKHVQSIQLAVSTGKWNWLWINGKGREGMKQRIADVRNYLILLAAIMDRYDKVGDDIVKSSVEKEEEEEVKVPEHSLCVISECYVSRLKENRRKGVRAVFRGEDPNEFASEHEDIWKGIYEEYGLNPEGNYRVDIRNGALTLNPDPEE